MFGIDDAIAIPAAGGLVSSALSYFGGQQTNSQNLDIYNQSNAFNAGQAVRAQEASAEQAQKTRDWQERMSNTQYQRAVKDMMAAGLNPMLAYHQGGAGTPSGATGSGFSASAGAAPRMENYLGSAVSSGHEGFRAASEGLKRANEIKIGDVGAKVAAAVERGIDAIEKSIPVAADKLSGLVRSIEDRITASKTSSSAAAVGEAAKEKIGNVIGPVVDAVVNPLRELVKGTSSAGSAASRSVVEAKERAARLIGSGESASSMPSARVQAQRSGRRLGTLGRQPRWSPEYGRGE